MAERLCRFGILGTAVIAQKNWQAIWHAPAATLTAVASRERQRAEQLIGDCQRQAPFDPPPAAFDSYEALLESDAVDAVYVPVPTALRKDWVIRAARAGKHVLAEKPAAPCVADLEEMLAACRENNVQYMDGVMFMHSRRLEAVRDALDNQQAVGKLRRIAAAFSFHGGEDFLASNIRVDSTLEPLGCLGDLGWYCIRFLLWIMKYQLPERVCGRMLSQHGSRESPQPVPTELSAELFFQGGVSATFYCSFITEHQQWAHLSGTGGYLRIDDFVLPYFGNELAFETNRAVFNVRGCDFNMEDYTRRHTVAEYGNSDPSAQETRMVQCFSQLALSGKPDESWGEIALKTQRVLDACLHSARHQGQAISL